MKLRDHLNNFIAELPFVTDKQCDQIVREAEIELSSVFACALSHLTGREIDWREVYEIYDANRPTQSRSYDYMSCADLILQNCNSNN